MPTRISLRRHALRAPLDATLACGARATVLSVGVALSLSAWLIAGPARAQSAGARSGSGVRTPNAAQAAATELEARNLFEAGEVVFTAGRYADALDYFQRAHALSGRPALLYNIALCHDRLRDDEIAIGAYERYLAAVPAAPNRDEVEGRLAALRAAVARRAQSTAATQAQAQTQAQIQTRQQVQVQAQVPTQTQAITPTPAMPPRMTVTEPARPQVAPARVAEAAESASRTAVPRAPEPRAALTMETPSSSAPADTSASPAFYETWWFWTVVGAVVVGGAVGVGVAATSEPAPGPGDVGGVILTLGANR